MTTIGTLCALLMGAALVCAQTSTAVSVQNAAPATAPSGATDPGNAAAAPGILETGLLIVSRDASFDLQNGTLQSQTQVALQPQPSPQGPPGFQWHEAMQQGAMLLTWRHSVCLFQAKTHSELGGPFREDHIRSLGGLHGWWDGDSYATDCLGHPMMGAVSGCIQAQNDCRRGRHRSLRHREGRRTARQEPDQDPAGIPQSEPERRGDHSAPAAVEA